MQRVDMRIVEETYAGAEVLVMLPPGFDRVGLVDTHRLEDGIP